MTTISYFMYYTISQSPSEFIQAKIMFDTARIFFSGLLIYISEQLFSNLILLAYHSISKNHVGLLYFIIPLILSLLMKYNLMHGLKCKLILKYLLLYQYSIFLFWPAETSLFFVAYWVETKTFLLIFIESLGILVALVLELYHFILIRRMIRLEVTGVFYSLENIGKKLPLTHIAENNLNITHILETTLAKEVIAWPIKIIQEVHVLPKNIEFQISDFTKI